VLQHAQAKYPATLAMARLPTLTIPLLVEALDEPPEAPAAPELQVIKSESVVSANLHSSN